MFHKYSLIIYSLTLFILSTRSGNGLHVYINRAFSICRKYVDSLGKIGKVQVQETKKRQSKPIGNPNFCEKWNSIGLWWPCFFTWYVPYVLSWLLSCLITLSFCHFGSCCTVSKYFSFISEAKKHLCSQELFLLPTHWLGYTLEFS